MPNGKHYFLSVWNSLTNHCAFHLMGMGRWYFIMEEQPQFYCRFEAYKLNSSELFGFDFFCRVVFFFF